MPRSIAPFLRATFKKVTSKFHCTVELKYAIIIL